MAEVLAYDGTVGIASSGAGGTFTEFGQAKNVTINQSRAQVDTTNRGDNGVRTSKAGLMDVSIDLEFMWDASVSGCNLILSAMKTGASLGMCFLDGSLASGEGPVFDASILQHNRSEPIEDGMMISVTAVPAPSSTAYSWTTSGVST